MASTDGLVGLFEAMTQNIEQDRAQLNSIDRGDGDTGDNMAANFRLITDTLAQSLGPSGSTTDIGEALALAAQQLNQNGQGATAPIYAQGLREAGKRLAGQTSFALDDLLPLLEGLLTGSRQASGASQGQGSLLDVLLPGILAYVQAKRGGQSDMDAILTALLNLRRGSFGTAQSPVGYGRSGGANTTGQIDPGAAGAASLLEGLFGALLRGALSKGGGAGGIGSVLSQPQAQSPATQPQADPAAGASLPLPGIPSGIGDLIGQLLGGAARQPAAQSAMPAQRRSHRKRS